MRRTGSGRRAAPVAKAVVKSLPSWDIDLGSVQDIRQVSLIVTHGEVLVDARLQVAALPIGQDETATWSFDVTGPLSDHSDIKVGVLGRYIRIEAPRLTLDGVDVLLPQPSKAMDRTLSQDALTINDGGWQVPALQRLDDSKDRESHALPQPQRGSGNVVPLASFRPTGTVQGTLRRTTPTSARGRMMAGRAIAAFGFGGGDEIIFR